MTDQRIPQVTGEALSKEAVPRAAVGQVLAEAIVRLVGAVPTRAAVPQVTVETIAWRSGTIRHGGVPQVLAEVLDTPRPGGPKLWLLRQPKLQFLGVKV